MWLTQLHHQQGTGGDLRYASNLNVGVYHNDP